MKIIIINGPNINMLGKRDSSVYGSASFDDLQECAKKFVASKKTKVLLDWYQSNLEGELINKLQALVGSDYDGVIINPGGLTHTSVALHDAMEILEVPVVEVHLSNTNAREDFRKNKITSRVANSVIEGFGIKSYLLAIESFLLGDSSV